jgi:AP-3 complex subunit mu
MDSFLVLETNGTILLEKHWREPPFSTKILVQTFLADKKPLILLKETAIITIERFELIFMALAGNLQSNDLLTLAYPTSVIYQLNSLLTLFNEYFAVISTQTILENYVTVYQLLEEWNDFGSLYITEPALLKQIVPAPSLLASILSSLRSHKPTPQGRITGFCPWRPTEIKHFHNEIFFDITEELSCIMDK